jgi:hypothetical protein
MSISRIGTFVHSYNPMGTFALTGINAHDLLLIGISGNDSTQPTPGISDTNSNTWNPLTILFDSPTGTSCQIWWADAKAGNMTATVTGMTSDPGGTLVQYRSTTGLAFTHDVDNQVKAGASSATPSGAQITTTGTGLVWGYYANELSTSTITAGTGYTLIQADGTHIDAQEEQLNTAAGNYTVVFNSSPGVANWSIYTTSFKEGVAAGGIITPPWYKLPTVGPSYAI